MKSLPTIRKECLPGGPNEQRPCRQDSCPYHLSHERESCTLDVADRGGATLDEVSDYLGLSRERVRQIEAVAIRKLKMVDVFYDLRN